MAEKKKPQQCLHDKRVQEEDAFLAEIDRVLDENEWRPTPRLIRRRSRKQVGTTEEP